MRTYWELCGLEILWFGSAPGEQIDHDELLVAPIMGKLHAASYCWIVASMVRYTWVQTDHDTDALTIYEAPGQAVSILTTPTKAGSSKHS